jgi:hypothetical protein
MKDKEIYDNIEKIEDISKRTLLYNSNSIEELRKSLIMISSLSHLIIKDFNQYSKTNKKGSYI